LATAAAPGTVTVVASYPVFGYNNGGFGYGYNGGYPAFGFGNSMAFGGGGFRQGSGDDDD